MTHDNGFDLSRRTVLGALGTIGAASAGAGLGTSAFLSDQETFENNRLVAGELDLKMDWQERYSDWSSDENIDPDDGSSFDVRMETPENADAFRAFPPGASEPLLWIPSEHVDDFVANTAVEAYPDPDDNGRTELPVEERDGQSPCEYLADVGGGDDGLHPDSDELGRTDADDTRRDDGSPAPLVALQDVKPGDFGTITFSAHLCDNPGYLWLNMPDGLSASDRGLTEPEADDPDEEAGVVELADELRTAIWYDGDCDSLVTCEEQVDIMAVADTSGSIEGDLDVTAEEEIDLIREGANTFFNQLLAATSPNADQIRAGLLTFNGPGNADEGDGERVFDRPALRAGLGPVERFDLDGDGSVNTAEFLPDAGNGNTPTPHALDLAQQVLNDQGRSSAQKVIVLIADGLPDYVSSSVAYTVTDAEGSPLTGSGATYTSGTYGAPSDAGGLQETAAVAEAVQQDGIVIIVAGISLDATAESFFGDEVAGRAGGQTVSESDYFFGVDVPETGSAATELQSTVGEMSQSVLGSAHRTCEKTIFSGSLREAAAALTANGGRGIPLDGNRDTPLDELGDAEGAAVRDCFDATTAHCFGFSWWLPVDHGNEVQSDGVSFDLGFYTEQCRHNDGGGMGNEVAVEPE